MLGLGLSLTMQRRGGAAAAVPAWVLTDDGGNPALIDARPQSDHFWFNGASYASYAAWATAVGASFSRASIGTYIDDAGVMQTAASGALRLDHDVSGNGLGWLIEPERTNLIRHSSNLSDGVWAGPGVITADDGLGADGTTTADRLTFGAQYDGKGQGWDTEIGVNYAVSLWLKHVSGNTSLKQYLTGVNYPITVTETLTRFEEVVTTTGTYSEFYLVQDGNAAGHGAVLFWGAQVEEGAFVTSYIPVVHVPVTRLADELTVVLANGDYDVRVQDSEGSEWRDDAVASGEYAITPRANKRHIQRITVFSTEVSSERRDVLGDDVDLFF